LVINEILLDWLPKINPDAHVSAEERRRALEDLWESFAFCMAGIEQIGQIHGFDVEHFHQLVEQ
jgi:hypothetical protein